MAPIYLIVLLCSLASAQHRNPTSGLGAGVSGDSSSSSGLRGSSPSGLSSTSGLRGSLEGLYQGSSASASEHARARSDLSSSKGLYSSSGLVRGYDRLGSVAGLKPASGYYRDGNANRYNSASSAGDQSRLSGHGLRGYGSRAHLREVSDLEGLTGHGSDRHAGHHLMEPSVVDHSLRLEDDLLTGSEASSRRPRLRPLIPYHNAPRGRPLKYKPSRFGPRHPMRPVLYRGDDSAYDSQGLDGAGSGYSNLGESALSYRGQGVDSSSVSDSDAVSGLGAAGDKHGHGLHGSGLHGVGAAGVRDASVQRAESDSLKANSGYRPGNSEDSKADLVSVSSGLSP